MVCHVGVLLLAAGGITILNLSCMVEPPVYCMAEPPVSAYSCHGGITSIIACCVCVLHGGVTSHSTPLHMVKAPFTQITVYIYIYAHIYIDMFAAFAFSDSLQGKGQLPRMQATRVSWMRSCHLRTAALQDELGAPSA